MQSISYSGEDTKALFRADPGNIMRFVRPIDCSAYTISALTQLATEFHSPRLLICKARSSRAPTPMTYAYSYRHAFESVLASAYGSVYEMIHGSVCRSVLDNFMVLPDKSIFV